MKEIKLENVLPASIEKRSMEIIGEELERRGVKLDVENEAVIKRVIHTTADFDYVDNLVFSDNAVAEIKKALAANCVIVTDTQMAKAGINKKKLAGLGGEVMCFMSDDDVAETAKKNGTTRAVASMDKASLLDRDIVFAIGNAPTALVRLYELICEGKLKPKGIIGVPVGFVNVVEAKDLILELDCPYIVARGRKGGSNVAAAICNAMMYQL